MKSSNPINQHPNTFVWIASASGERSLVKLTVNKMTRFFDIDNDQRERTSGQNCESAQDFQDFAKYLANECKNSGKIPLIFLDFKPMRSDTDEVTGMRFANGDELPWKDLMIQLRDINRNTGSRLVVISTVHSTSYSFYAAIGQKGAPPFQAYISPVIDNFPRDRLEDSLETFFKSFTSSGDLEKAFEWINLLAIARESLSAERLRCWRVLAPAFYDFGFLSVETPAAMLLKA